MELRRVLVPHLEASAPVRQVLREYPCRCFRYCGFRFVFTSVRLPGNILFPSAFGFRTLVFLGQVQEFKHGFVVETTFGSRSAFVLPVEFNTGAVHGGRNAGVSRLRVIFEEGWWLGAELNRLHKDFQSLRINF